MLLFSYTKLMENREKMKNDENIVYVCVFVRGNIRKFIFRSCVFIGGLEI
jgi:hypothetical protein